MTAQATFVNVFCISSQPRPIHYNAIIARLLAAHCISSYWFWLSWSLGILGGPTKESPSDYSQRTHPSGMTHVPTNRWVPMFSFQQAMQLASVSRVGLYRLKASVSNSLEKYPSWHLSHYSTFNWVTTTFGWLSH